MPSPPVSVTDLERLAGRAWQGLEEQPYGDWLLRAGGGFTGRANSVLVVGKPPGDLPSAVDAVTGWYLERGLRPRAAVPEPGADAADGAFAAAGWSREEDTLVLTAPLRPWTTRCPDVDVQLATAPDEAWLATYAGDAPLHPAAVDVLRRAEGVLFASVRLDSPPAPPAAVARGALSGGWLVVNGLTVDPVHRRRGLATRLMSELASDAMARGGSSCVLQVLVSNAGALALYARLGFTEHHRYHYRTAPEPG